MERLPNRRFLWAGGSAILCVCLLLYACSGDTARRTLVVSLYPFIPNAKAAYFDIEKNFELANPDIDLRINLAKEYYSTTPNDGSILEEVADVYEIDSVFLADFVRQGKVQALAGDLAPGSDLYSKVAMDASQWNGTPYGLPHWLCGNFLFYTADDPAIGNAKNLIEIEKAFAAPGKKQGLLADFFGSSTVGEMYLDALVDRVGSSKDAIAALAEEKADPSVVAAMGRAIKLFPKGYGRDEEYHRRVGFYARLFARGGGRALVGYSEQLFYVLDEVSNDCGKNEGCIRAEDIRVAEWPLADRGSQPIAWVDLLAISSNAQGVKLKDAEAFLRFMASESTYNQFLEPPPEGGSPRYLLPARSDVAQKQKPKLYAEMFKIMQRAVTVTAPDLNRRLRKIGGDLKTSLPTNP